MRSTKLTALLALLVSAPAAMAAETWGEWNLSQVTTTAYATTWSASAGTWSGALTNATVCSWGGIASPSGTNEGGGACSSSTAPEHAADNFQATEMFSLGFAQKVRLSEVRIGYNGSDNLGRDSDMSVLAFDDSVAGGSFNVAGKTLAQLLNSGWKYVGKYADVGKSNGATAGGTATVTTTFSSSWWLISAYNSAFGSTSDETVAYGGGTFTTGINNTPNGSTTGSTSTKNDYFKLLSVAGYKQDNGKVPEPGSLALLGVGLIGLLRASRKNKQ